MREMVRLGDVGTIITGNTPKTSDKENYSSKDIPFIKPSDISETEISTINCSEYYIAEQAKNKARIIPINSILVTCIGIIGKIGINKIECAFNQQINSIIPDLSKCISEYLAYAIYSRKLFLQNIANAPVVPILNKSQFSDIEIPLPPLPEQRRIAAVLDKVSELIALRKKQLDLLDEMVKARFVEMFGDPVRNEKGYIIQKLKDLSIKISDGVHNKPVYTETGYPFISVVNINKGILNFSNCKYVSESDYNKMIKSTNPEQGDILYTKVGATYGIPAYIDTNRKFCLYVSVCLIKPNHDKINSRFLALSMSMPYIKRQADSRIKGIGVPDLHLNQISEFDILCPPNNEQHEYVSFVLQIEKSKATVQQGLDRLNLLKSALMQEYFG